MSAISFAVDPATNPSTPVVESPTAPANPTCGVPAVVSAPSPLVMGDAIPDFKDLMIPRLNITQNIGPLSESFSPGSIIHNQTLELYHPAVVNRQTSQITTPSTSPISLVCLGMRPIRFAEKVAGGIRGALVNSEAEVVAAGGTTDYKEHQLKQAAGMKFFQPLAEALVLIERPAHVTDDDSVFNYSVEGRKWTLCLWAMKGGSFTQAFKKVLATARVMGVLRNGYPAHTFSMATRLETYSGQNTAWVPVLIPKEKTSPALLDFAKGVLSGE